MCAGALWQFKSHKILHKYVVFHSSLMFYHTLLDIMCVYFKRYIFIINDLENSTKAVDTYAYNYLEPVTFERKLLLSKSRALTTRPWGQVIFVFK